MSERERLESEFAVFARYLGWQGNTDRLKDAYVSRHVSAQARPANAMDAWLARTGGRSWVAVTLADAYARFVAPSGLLRRKLVLTLSILESARESHATFDSAIAAPIGVTGIRIGLLLARWGVTSVLAIVALAPVHLIVSLTGGKPGDG